VKKIFFLFLLSILSIPSFSQCDWFSDFEPGYPDFSIIPDSTHLWQVGLANKNFLNTVLDSDHIIITDTLADYPNNVNSSFTIFPFCYLVGDQATLLTFDIKIDADTLRDGLYIEFSLDGGFIWTNIKYDSWAPYNDTELSDTLANGEYGFSGREEKSVGFASCVSYNVTGPIMFRFNFISDSIDNHREGCMIDNISVTHLQCEGIEEITGNYHFSGVYPNLVSNISFLQIKNQNQKIKSIQFFSSLGMLEKTISQPYQNNFPILKKDFSPGIYFYRIQLVNGKMDEGKFLVK
jgi:hypothetical protein